ncbi:ABC transporter permease [Lactococcus muris]|uniref:ABC transporter permease n=1 Tax=Lactococcus muris TaxID=2941330 RepID=A0ABV4DAM2_9LACT
MNLKRRVFSAYQALKQNLRRSLLTMLGIVIGIASVITILSLGQGFQSYTIKNLRQETGKNVSVDINFTPNDFENNTSIDGFNELDLHLVEQVEGVSSVKYKHLNESSIMKEFRFQTGKYSKVIDFKKESQVTLLHGRNFFPEDNQLKNKVAVMSKETAEEISPNIRSVIGYGIPIDGELYTVIGIAQGRDSDELFSDSADIEIPQNTYESYHNKNNVISSISISIQQGYKPSTVANSVVKKLSQDGSMSSQGTYSTLDMSSLLDGISKILSTLTLFISGVAGISLFIAGVGVMNMMYTSVSERTKEIGIRRALGAKRSEIRYQFLTEGLLLTISSGLIGYLLGFLVALVISQFLPFEVRPTFFTVGIAIGSTSLLGLFFSITPANAAARKDLVEILR